MALFTEVITVVGTAVAIVAATEDVVSGDVTMLVNFVMVVLDEITLLLTT